MEILYPKIHLLKQKEKTLLWHLFYSFINKQFLIRVINHKQTKKIMQLLSLSVLSKPTLERFGNKASKTLNYSTWFLSEYLCFGLRAATEECVLNELLQIINHHVISHTLKHLTTIEKCSAYYKWQSASFYNIYYIIDALLIH